MRDQFFFEKNGHPKIRVLMRAKKNMKVTGDEIHIICHCPATQGVLQQFTAKFQGLTRLLDLPPFASFTPDEKTRMVLGNPPPQVRQKGLKGWITETTPRIYTQNSHTCVCIYYRIYTRSLHEYVCIFACMYTEFTCACVCIYVYGHRGCVWVYVSTYIHIEFTCVFVYITV